ncbi:pentatricopeptide repeat-containing protein At1g18485 [Lolium perenne]|uniref:pentatricopeptide repeat-containing protein At1g18485 n=1 Tax=Lolium perenne TaxID=4522 RepID=UPI0021EA3F5E|nr:pentatricopeptide repeat-containing protein At1g18485-like [Lolium perenne]XP_051185376.1 pentatricopeptide repeat-containing protein At1g18485-like [Lolium perenne]
MEQNRAPANKLTAASLHAHVLHLHQCGAGGNALRRAHAASLVSGALAACLPLAGALLLSYAAIADLPSSRLILLHHPLRLRSAFLWNSLSRALSSASLPSEALRVYNLMLRSAVSPDDRTFPFALHAAAAAAEAHPAKGLELHAAALRSGHLADVFAGNTLVAFYAARGSAHDACRVFDEMPVRDVVSWNSLVSAFLTNKMFDDARQALVSMMRSGNPVNVASLVSVVPACGVEQEEGFGMGIHGLALKTGLDAMLNLGNALIDMYGKLGHVQASMQVFEGMPERSEVSWNSAIGCFLNAGLYGDVLAMFREMSERGVMPGSITLSSLLPALVELGYFDLGREVHGYSIKREMDLDIFVANSLVDMYAKLGSLEKACTVFEKIKAPNVVSWNAMVANLVQNGAEVEAFRLVIKMQNDGERPNSITLVNVLPACSRLASIKLGKQIHAWSIRTGLTFDLFISNALIDMYAKCGQLTSAQNIFDLSEKDDVSYNTLILGYSQSPWSFKSLNLFKQMRSVGVEYDAISFMGALTACTNLCAFKQGKVIHGVLVRRLQSNHPFLENSLLGLYTKGAMLDTASKIFNRMTQKDVASWNTMIMGYAMQGQIDVAFQLFDLMKDDGVNYDHVSYIAVLSACSHGGLVESGKKYFSQMLAQNLEPQQMHYACMVDLLGRAGQLTESVEIILDMPFHANSDVWGALLGACRIHGNIELAQYAAEHLFELKPEHSGYYTLLINMYAEAGRWNEANKIRTLMKSRKVQKNPAYSWVQSGNKLQAFLVGYT